MLRPVVLRHRLEPGLPVVDHIPSLGITTLTWEDNRGIPESGVLKT